MMRRIYLREPSALIPTVTKNIFIKSKYIEHLSEKHHVDFQTIKKNLQICRSFFHGKKKKKVRTFYTLVNSDGTSSSEVGSNMYYVCQHDGHSKAHRRKEEPDRKTNK